MKRFKDYSTTIDSEKQARIDRDLLSWPSSNGEMRDKLPKSDTPEPMLSWDSSFAGMRDAVAKMSKNKKLDEALETKAPDGSRAHFLHHVAGYQNSYKKKRELRNEYGYNVADSYSGPSYGVSPKKFKKAQNQYRQHESAITHHEVALQSHHPDLMGTVENTFGHWSDSSHSPTDVKAIAAAHYDGNQAKKKIASIAPHTPAHIKATIAAYHAHNDAFKAQGNDYSHLAYSLQDIHRAHRDHFKKSLDSTYGTKQAAQLMDAHAAGTLHATSKTILKSYAGKTDSSLSKSNEPANFLGAGKVTLSPKNRKTHREWENEVTKHNNIPQVENAKGRMHHAIHNHPDVEPSVVTDKDRDVIDRYTGSYSGTINGYLRYRAGDRSSGQYPGYGVGAHRETEGHIKSLSAVFGKGNTNRIPIHTWSGVPEHVGKDLMGSTIGSYHHIAGFTSTTTHKNTANNFAVAHAGSSQNDRHVIHYKVQRGAGLSVASHSGYDENEVILHHGAQIKYHGTTVYHPNNGSGMSHKIHVHHVTVYPKTLPLSKYGPIGDEYK